MQDNQQQCALCDKPATVWTSFVCAAGKVRAAALCDKHAQACGWLDAKGWGLLDGWNLSAIAGKNGGGEDDLLQTALSAMVESVSSMTGGHFKSVAVQLHKIVDGVVTPDVRAGASRQCCPQCGFTAADWKELGRLGCPDCYRTFGAAIRRQLPSLHGGAEVHWGKIPHCEGEALAAACRQRVGRLREQLAAAVRREDYEQASDVRDRIHELELRAAGQVRAQDTTGLNLPPAEGK